LIYSEIDRTFTILEGVTKDEDVGRYQISITLTDDNELTKSKSYSFDLIIEAPEEPEPEPEPEAVINWEPDWGEMKEVSI